MKKEYDFSKAEQGRFYRPLEKLNIPIYLEQPVRDFYNQQSFNKNIKLDNMINFVLSKEMELLKKVG
jgi:hypothetical protein